MPRKLAKRKAKRKVAKKKTSKRAKRVTKRRNPYTFFFRGSEFMPSGIPVKDYIKDFKIEKRSVGHAGPLVKDKNGKWWSVNALQKFGGVIDVRDFRYELRPDQVPK